MDIKDLVYNLVYKYKTKYESGFIESEIEDLLSNFPDINMKKFNNALSYITCEMQDGNFVTYRFDIVTALLCGIENRDLTEKEFD